MSDINDIKINVDPKHIPRLMPFKAVVDIRYYLQGIYVEKAPQGGVYLVATDGHSMAVIYDSTGKIEGADSAIVHVTTALGAACKTVERRGNRDVPYRFLVERQRARVAAEGSEFVELHVQAGRAFIEGKFPIWRKVVPDLKALKQGALSGGVGINPTYLGRFAKLSASKRFPGIALWQEKPNGPVVVQLQDVPEMIGLVMPIREMGNPAHFDKFMPVAAIPDEVLEPA